MFPDCIDAADTYQRIATHLHRAIKVTHVCCDRQRGICGQIVRRNMLPYIVRIHDGKVHPFDMGEQKLEHWMPSVLNAIPDHQVKFLGPDVPESCYHLLTFEFSECSHCYVELLIALARFYGLAGDAPYDTQDELRIGRINCAQHEDLCARFGLLADDVHSSWKIGSTCAAGSTTVEYGDDGSVTAGWSNLDVLWYEEDMSATHILSFMLMQMSSKVETFKTEDEFNAVMATDKDAYIVAHMPPDCVECEDFELDVTILGHLAATFQNPKFPGLRLRVAKVECNDLPQRCNPFGDMAGRPGFMIFPFGTPKSSPHLYEGILTPSHVLEKAKEETDPVALTHLTAENFHQLVMSQSDNWLVLFTAGPWCPPCNHMKPIYLSACRLLEPHTDKFKLGIFDGDAYRQMAVRLGIQGFPAVRAYIGSKTPMRMFEFEGHRIPREIHDFALESLNNLVHQMGDNMISISQGTEYWIVKFSAGAWCPPCMFVKQFWAELAVLVEGEYSVGAVDCDSSRRLCHSFNINSYPTIVVCARHPNGKRLIKVHNGPRNPQAIRDFAMELKARERSRLTN